MARVFVLGVDPGFRSFGYGVVELLPTSERIVDVNVIRTKKDTAKSHVLASEDNFRRSRAIFAALKHVVTTYQPAVLTAETMSFPRNAATAAKMAMSWGVISAIAEEFQLPVAQASPVKVKQATTGSPTASKEDVQDALRRRYKGEFFPFQAALPESEWEHGFDAVGTVVACLSADVLRLARNMNGKEMVAP